MLAVLCGLVFLAAPLLRRADPALMEGIVAVHLQTAGELPALEALGEGDDLVVWPEGVLNGKVPTAEGPTPRKLTLVPFTGTGVEHLVGSLITSPIGTQNALLHVIPRGDVA